MSLKVGDVVTLRSGGPKMTVGAVVIEGDVNFVTCEWFHPTGYTIETTYDVYCQESEFHPDTLVKVEEKETA